MLAEKLLNRNPLPSTPSTQLTIVKNATPKTAKTSTRKRLSPKQKDLRDRKEFIRLLSRVVNSRYCWPGLTDSIAEAVNDAHCEYSKSLLSPEYFNFILDIWGAQGFPQDLPGGGK